MYQKRHLHLLIGTSEPPPNDTGRSWQRLWCNSTYKFGNSASCCIFHEVPSKQVFDLQTQNPYSQLKNFTEHITLNNNGFVSLPKPLRYQLLNKMKNLNVVTIKCIKLLNFCFTHMTCKTIAVSTGAAGLLLVISSNVINSCAQVIWKKTTPS